MYRQYQKSISRMGLDWRFSLLQECSFYYLTCHNWRDVVRARLYRTPLQQYVLRAGGIINFSDAVPPWQVFQEVWRRRVYTRQYHPNINPRTVVDIGANIGFFTLLAASRWPQAQIYAYEPVVQNVQLLVQNAKSVASPIQVFAVAVAASRGTMPFYLKKEAGWHSLLPEGAIEKTIVNTVSLDDVISNLNSPLVDFLKIDCEGAEFSILQGRERLLAECVSEVALEYHEGQGHTYRDLQDLFCRSGFKCVINTESHCPTGMLYARNLHLNNI